MDYQLKLKNKFFQLSLISILVYQIFCIFWGLDLTDEGWGMSFYQQIFHNPETVKYHFVYYLTGIIGGGMYELYPGGGFIFMRLFGVIIITLTYYFSYKLMYRYFSSNIIIIGLFAQILIVVGDPKPFGYNSLTAFLLVISCFCFLKGLRLKDNRYTTVYYILGGFIIGINVFVKLPNLASIILLTIPSIISYRRKGEKIQSLLPFLGCLIGIFVVIAVMFMLGHSDYFISAVDMIKQNGSDVNNTHSLVFVIKTTLKLYFKLVIYGSILVTSVFLYSIIKRKWMRVLYCCVVCGILCLFLLKFNDYLRENNLIIINYISIFGALLFLYKHNYSKENLLVVTFGLFMCFLIPFGSDGAFTTCWTGTWISLPIGCVILYDMFVKYSALKITVDGKDIKIISPTRYVKCLLYVYFLCSIYQNLNIQYFDPGCIAKKTTTINSRFTHCIYTESARAIPINELLSALRDIVGKDDYLFVYDFFPGLNYITNTKPYLSNSWPWVYSVSLLNKQIQEKVAKGIFPIVVRHKFRTCNLWSAPSDKFYDLDYNEEKLTREQLARLDVINDFLDKNNYRKIWENSHFEIFEKDFDN